MANKIREGEVLHLEKISLNPVDIDYIDFIIYLDKSEGVEVVHKEKFDPKSIILKKEIESVKDFAEVNNLVRHREVRDWVE